MNGKRYVVRYTELALENLGELPKREASQLIRKITRLEGGLHGNIKRLQGGDIGYRLRMGDYRVLFDVKDAIILVQKIGHRKDVYD
ncbi:MAG: type II toxin-antitoxin system RelE family toxin [Verrucomicrobiia bacterium]